MVSDSIKNLFFYIAIRSIIDLRSRKELKELGCLREYCVLKDVFDSHQHQTGACRLEVTSSTSSVLKTAPFWIVVIVMIFHMLGMKEFAMKFFVATHLNKVGLKGLYLGKKQSYVCQYIQYIFKFSVFFKKTHQQ
jgi:hypothetical protein